MATATIKIENHSTIRKLDLDTAEYIIEKVIDAVVGTVNNMAYPDINKDGYEVMLYKDHIEMFEDFSNKLVNILNEIKEKKEGLR